MPPLLSELPPAPPGKLGWPWTTASQPLMGLTSQGQDWPRITVITPSYNQGKFIEETIRSILLQGYPDLEYLIIDGGSTDNTVEIIRKYERWLGFWTSEPDRGQSHAINKGLSRATGSLWGWINSDDLLLPDSIGSIADLHIKFPRDLIAGDVIDFWNGQNQRRLIKQADIELRKFDQPSLVLTVPKINNVPCYQV